MVTPSIFSDVTRSMPPGKDIGWLKARLPRRLCVTIISLDLWRLSVKLLVLAQLLERVQHRFTRMFRHLRQLDYSTRLDILGLWSLEKRRNRADLIEVFKIMRGFFFNFCGRVL